MRTTFGSLSIQRDCTMKHVIYTSVIVFLLLTIWGMNSRIVEVEDYYVSSMNTVKTLTINGRSCRHKASLGEVNISDCGIKLFYMNWDAGTQFCSTKEGKQAYVNESTCRYLMIQDLRITVSDI